MTTILAVFLALAPGSYAWWTGRTLLERVTDPAFPELLLARGQRLIHVAVAAVVLSTFVHGPTTWVWSFPLFVLATLVGNFPFRRALYGETWGIVDYIRYMLFSVAGGAGFWLALGFAPLLILALVGGWSTTAPIQTATIVGAVFAAALVAWEYAYPVIWLALNRASPLRRDDLDSRFDEIVRRSAVSHRPPQVFRFGPPGAYVMNAFALPSTRRPRVAFGNTTLELLTTDEIVAVFAHEVSHLEHYDPRRLLRLRLLTYVLIACGTALPALLLAAVPAQAWIAKLVWPIVVFALLALRISKSQAHETESDLRAGALTGDPEAMVRALTKLHHYSRMPRRWPYDFERAATHPSLARRIQALRTQPASPTDTGVPRVGRLDTPTILRSTEPGTFVALEDARGYWFDGVPADASADSLAALREQAASYRAVAYRDLTELRVAVIRGGRRALLARDRTGKTWSTPLRLDDVAAAQHALDVLDVQLGNHAREDWTTKARVIATLLALALVGSLDFSWPWIPLLITLAKPSAASVAAMGAMAVFRVIIGAFAGALGATALGAAWPVAWVAVTAVFGIGVWACHLAWRWARGDERPERESFTRGTLAFLATLIVGALAVTHALHNLTAPPLQVVSQSPGGGLAIVLVGVGAALLTYQDLLRHRSGIALGLVGLGGGALVVSGERLIVRAGGPGIAWTSGRAEVAGRFDIPNSVAYQLRLSPGGRRFAVQGPGRRPARYEDSGDEAANVRRFTIGSIGGARRTTEALDLAFLDDDRVLVLRPYMPSGDSLELSAEQADGGSGPGSWRRVIPIYFAPTLAVDLSSGTWRVVSHDVQAGAIVTSAGPTGGDSVRTTRSPSTPLGGRSLHTYRDGTSLVGTLHTSFGARQMLLAMFGLYPYRWDVWHLVNGERRPVGVLPGFPECGPPAGNDESVFCVVRGRSAVSIWKLGPRDAVDPTSVGTLPPRHDIWDFGADGAIAATSRDGGTLALVDARSGHGTRVALGGVTLQSTQPIPDTYATDVAVASDVVGLLIVGDQKAQVVFYRVK